MSQDSGSEQRQRTVAELLAQYGESGARSAEPKRRRRRADDAAEETAPQAIIDRVLSDSGRMRPVPPVEQDEAQPPAPQQPPPGNGFADAYPDAARPAQPVRPQRRARRGPSRFGAPVEPPQPDAQQTRQQPAVPPVEPPGPPMQAGPPPRANVTHPAMPPVSGTQQNLPPAEAPPANRTQHQPPVPPAADNGTGAGLRARLGGAPAESHTEQLPAITDVEPPGPRPAGLRKDSPLVRGSNRQEAPAGDAENLEQTQFGMPPLPEGDEAGYRDTGYVDSDYADGDYADQDSDYVDADGEYADDYADDDYAEEYDDGYDEREQDEAPAERGSPARDWLVLVGLMALSVVGGAAVWLGFDWLWGQIPAAALVGALVVIGGMVWIVRRVRNDDDLQTTVASVLVGLVVTVSPAALLLLKQ